jgi:hypothetical protein
MRESVHQGEGLGGKALFYPSPVFFHMDSLCPSGCAMMKIKNTKSPMKNIKTAKARLRGSRPACFNDLSTE